MTGIFQWYYTFKVVTATTIVNTTHFIVTYNFPAVNVTAVTSTFLVIDVTSLQSTRTLYVDHFVMTISSSLSTLWLTHYNYHANLSTYI